MRNLEMILIALQQIPGVSDTRLAEAILNTDAGKLMLVVMLLAILSNAVTVIIMLRFFRSDKDASNKIVNQLAATIEIQNNTLASYQEYMQQVREDQSESDLSNRTYTEQTRGKITEMVSTLAKTQTDVAALLIDESNLHAETRNIVITQNKQNLAEMVDMVIAQRQLDLFDEFSNPAPDDCRFKVRLVRATTPDLATIGLYIVPILKDNNTAGSIRGTGEVVQVIEDLMLPGWVFIKQLYGESPSEGYVRRRLIEIQALPIEDAPAVRPQTAPLNIPPTPKSDTIRLSDDSNEESDL